MIFGLCLIWKNKRYRGLSYILIFSGCAMIFNLTEELGRTREYYLVTPIFLLGKGPLFYFFVYQLIYPDKKITHVRLFHLCPMLLALAFTQWPQSVIALGTISQVIYVYLSIMLISNYHKASFSMRSDADSLQLFWLIKVLITLLLVGAVDLIRLNIQPNITLELNLAGQLFENAAILLLLSYLIFKAVNHRLLFNGMNAFEKLNKEDNERDALENDEITKTIFVSLEHIVKEKSLHHKSRLSLNDLAIETGLNTRDISRAINQCAHCSFCDYINKLRVEDLKAKLLTKKEDKTSILDIAFSVGFNSKSSLNLIFKRETGKTPTQFLKNFKNKQL
jgi:AraC-like DNA-binding protein